MELKVIKTQVGEYILAEYQGYNTAGFEPVGDRVIVLPDMPAEATKGGVFLTEDLQEKQAASADTGVIIAVGDDAFTWNSDRTRDFGGTKPKPGDRVYFERFAGGVMMGADGLLYRVMDDKCIGAFVAS